MPNHKDRISHKVRRLLEERMGENRGGQLWLAREISDNRNDSTEVHRRQNLVNRIYKGGSFEVTLDLVERLQRAFGFPTPFAFLTSGPGPERVWTTTSEEDEKRLVDEARQREEAEFVDAMLEAFEKARLAYLNGVNKDVAQAIFQSVGRIAQAEGLAGTSASARLEAARVVLRALEEQADREADEPGLTVIGEHLRTQADRGLGAMESATNIDRSREGRTNGTN